MHSPPRKFLNMERALDVMRRGREMVRLHGQTEGCEYYIVDGGPVTSATAEAILCRPDVQPHSSGLFPGCDQSWRLRSSSSVP